MAEDPWGIVFELEVIFRRRGELVAGTIVMLAGSRPRVSQITQTLQN
jgi:hypothetical protein